MTIRRKLLNFGSRSTDFRIGAGALGEFGRMAAASVAKPVRALLVVEGACDAAPRETVTHALIDAGFAVEEFELAPGEPARSLSTASRLYAALAGAKVTVDDLVVGLGGMDACSLAVFCAQTWCGGTAAVLVPTELDAMVACATEMRGLDAEGGPEMVSLRPYASLVVCDLDLVMGASLARNGLGYARIVSAYLAESRRYWDGLAAIVSGLVDGRELSFIDAVCDAQTSLLNSVKSVSPSARSAPRFGMTTAHALRACLGADAPWYRLVAEGMRFEARVAVEAVGFSADDMFEQDDRLENLGIEELGFALAPERFLEALRCEGLRRSNRFLFPLPKYPGGVRLAGVDDDLLARHAAAYLASRAELLDSEA